MSLLRLASGVRPAETPRTPGVSLIIRVRSSRILEAQLLAPDYWLGGSMRPL